MKPERVLTFDDVSWTFWRWSEADLIANVDPETDELELYIQLDQQEVPRG